MWTEPKIVEWAEQPYVAIRVQVTMPEIGEVLPPLIAEVFRFVAEHGGTPAGAPFFKYNVIDMERYLDIEVGAPVAAPIPGDERVLAGVLPAGRYATLLHTGHPRHRIEATSALLAWAEQQGLTWDVTDTPEGRRWRCRLELHRTDPAQQHDMDKWETELAFRLV